MRGTGWKGRGRSSGTRGGSGANSVPLGRMMAGAAAKLLPPTTLLPPTVERERLESLKRKERETEVGEEVESEGDKLLSPARKISHPLHKCSEPAGKNSRARNGVGRSETRHYFAM